MFIKKQQSTPRNSARLAIAGHRHLRQNALPIAPLFLAALTTLATSPGRVLAAEDTPPWYQVEVIVFSQQDIFREESNRRDSKLEYPQNMVLLRPSSAAAGQQIQLHSLLIEQPTPLDQLLAATASAEPPRPEAFVSLAEKDMLLRAEAASLNRSGIYKVLFHQAWRQPGLDENQSPWVQISGGGTFDGHHELEGSLRLVKSRYLHIQADLWRTVFDYLDPETAAEIPQAKSWPTLPLAPKPPEDPRVAQLAQLVAARKQALADAERSFWSQIDSEPGFDGSATAVPDSGLQPSTTGDETPADTAVAYPDSSDVLEQAPAPMPEPSVGLPAQQSPDTEPAIAAEPQAPDEVWPEAAPTVHYRVTDMDTLDLSRRVDTSSLHYLDHPRIGVIVRVSAYKLPEVEIQTRPPASPSASTR